MASPSPTLVFNYDISCPFAYIASTRVQALAQRTNATLIYRPVLLGAIYRATAAPQGAGGSASDVFNSAKKAVTAKSMQRTLARYQIAYHPPPKHPRKTVNALRMLYCVPDPEKRKVLTDRLFRAYWVEGRDVNDDAVLLQIARESGVEGLDASCFGNVDARKELERATGEAIERGAFGVPGFWISDAGGYVGGGKGGKGSEGEKGRFFWGQDRMHFVEATLLGISSSSSASSSDPWTRVPNLRSLLPRCIHTNKLASFNNTTTTTPSVKLEFWFDFSSPWAFLGYTQLSRLQRTFGPGLEIVLKPFLLGILFREIGAPNMPILAVSSAKAEWSKRDHADWTRWWNAVDVQEGQQQGGKEKDGLIKFHWADTFPIRTPTVLRVGIAEPATTKILCKFFLSFLCFRLCVSEAFFALAGIHQAAGRAVENVRSRVQRC
jgi:2-hydroxychromene-2-carboxylate isomerase